VIPPIDPPPTDPPLPVNRAAQVNRTETDALLVAAGRGDLDAFMTFYDRTVGVVFALLHQDLGPRAELATTQVYLQLWRTAAGFDPAVCSAYATLLSTACRALTGLRFTACRPTLRRDPRRPALTTPPQTPPMGPRQDRTEPHRGAVCPTASYR
jgi:hypothetical protein